VLDADSGISSGLLILVGAVVIRNRYLCCGAGGSVRTWTVILSDRRATTTRRPRRGAGSTVQRVRALV